MRRKIIQLQHQRQKTANQDKRNKKEEIKLQAEPDELEWKNSSFCFVF